MRRRNLLFAPAVIFASCAVHAQATSKQHRIAFVHSAIAVDDLTEQHGPFWVRRLFAELRRLGYVEGENVVVQRYSGKGNPALLPALSRDIVASNPDVIVANFTLPVRAALTAATSTIPIVAIMGDPITYGIVRSLARPGGNVTGVTIDAGITVNGKRLQTLKQALPAVSRVAVITSRLEWGAAGGQQIQVAGEKLGIQAVGVFLDVASDDELKRVFKEISDQRVDAVVVSGSGDLLANRAAIVRLAHEHRIPAIYPYRDFVELGGLLAYAPDAGETGERLAQAVAQVLRGANPGEVPIQQATKFKLIINVSTAKALGLTISPALLAQADEVIE